VRRSSASSLHSTMLVLDRSSCCANSSPRRVATSMRKAALSSRCDELSVRMAASSPCRVAISLRSDALSARRAAFSLRTSVTSLRSASTVLSSAAAASPCARSAADTRRPTRPANAACACMRAPPPPSPHLQSNAAIPPLRCPAPAGLCKGADRSEAAHVPRDGPRAAAHVRRQLAPSNGRPAPRHRARRLCARAHERVRCQLTPRHRRPAAPRAPQRPPRALAPRVPLRAHSAPQAPSSSRAPAEGALGGRGTPREAACTPSPAQPSDLHGAPLDGLAAVAARHPRERAPRRVAWARGNEGEAEPFIRAQWARRGACGLCRRVAALHCGALTGGLPSRDPVAAARRVDGARDRRLRALRPVRVEGPQRPRPPAQRRAPRAHRPNDKAHCRAGCGLAEACPAAARALLLLGQRNDRAAGAAQVAPCNSNNGGWWRWA